MDVFKDPCEMTNTGKWLQQKILFKFLYCGSASGFWLLPLALSAAAALHRVSFCELLLQFLVNSWSYHYIFFICHEIIDNHDNYALIFHNQFAYKARQNLIKS